MGEEDRSDDELAAPDGGAPFRPWGASGVPHPGADRPRRAAPAIPPPVPYEGDVLPGRSFPEPPAAAQPDPGTGGPAWAEGRPPKFLPQAYPRQGGPSQPYPPHGYPQQPVRVEYVHVNASRGPSGVGLAAFILGILSFLIPWFGLLSLAALVLGIAGRGRGSSGEGFATAGLILGLTSVLLYLVVFRGLMFLFLFR